MSDVIDYFNRLPLAGLMLVVAVGYLVGSRQVRGFSLSPAGGTLIVAILFGHLGLSFAEMYGSEEPQLTIGLFGFALFIYSVGFEAGPRFFSDLRGSRGWRTVAIGVLVNVVALAVAVTCGKLFSLDSSTTAGVLSGALTSTPTYAAAAEVCRDVTLLAVSFAFTYPLGLAGLVILMQVLPRLMRDDLSRASLPAEEGFETRRTRPGELERAFELRRPDAVGRTLAELALSGRTGCYLMRLHRGQRIVLPDATTRLEEGDHVLARGSFEQLRALERIIGPEVYDEELQRRMASPRAVHVSSKEVVGRTLQEIDLIGRHHCLITEVGRHGVDLQPSAEFRLLRDDVVHVSGEHDDVRAVARELGAFERATTETDIAIYAGGIVLGLLVGSIQIGDLRLGMAGGLLLVGVLLGRFRRIGILRAHVPLPARQLVRDLGSLLFVAETGVRAGGRIGDGMSGLVGPAVATGAIVTLLAVVIPLLVGRFILRMRPVDVWGAICGGMTSAAALVVIRRAADSNEPATSYAQSFAVASVLAALAGQFVILLMG